jgi:uncharacterized protein (TIGR03435 family)
MKTDWSKGRLFIVATIIMIAVIAALIVAKKIASPNRSVLTAKELSRISDPFEKSKMVFAAVNDLIARNDRERGNRLASKKEIEEESKKTEGLYEIFWKQAPIGAIIQPTHSTNGCWRSWYRENQIIEMAVPFTTLLGAAYKTNGHYFSSGRMVFSADIPSANFDFLLNDTNQGEKSLRAEIQKQFGLAGSLELRETNVLVLKLKNRGAPALKFGAVPKYDLNASFARPLTTSQLAETLEEEFFHNPVIDETGLAGTIYFFALPHKPEDLDLLKQTLLEQSGLELVSERRPIETLIVEKAN